MSTIPPATPHAASGQNATAGNEARGGHTAADVSPASPSGACSRVPWGVVWSCRLNWCNP
jgi:hypothetical protein